MKIDRSHRSWMIVSAVTLAAASGAYWNYKTHGSAKIVGTSGGSVEGITFGIVGAAFMLFAGLLGARKRFRTWRIGRAEFWMRGHLWLGALSLPMIWFHGGFKHGGTLTTALMWLTYGIVLSGIVGAALQHFVPRLMTVEVPDETVYEQIPQVIRHLRAEAEDVVAVCGPESGEDLNTWRQGRAALLRARAGKALMTEERRDALLHRLELAPAAGCAPLREFYVGHVRPFLEGKENRSALADPIRLEALFAQRKLALPPQLHEPLEELMRICEEVRQLMVQRRLHHVMHTWLLVHIPLSTALLVLAVVHIVVSLRYAF